MEEAHRETGHGPITRRHALAAGAGALASLALAGSEAPAAAARGPGRRSRRPPVTPRTEVSFDEGWRFHRGDAPGAQAPVFDDAGWRVLDVPHDWRIEDLPQASSDDGAATANPSGMAFVTKPSTDGSPPAVIGPFDAGTPGGRGQAYTVGGVAWYRKHFRLPGVAPRAHAGADKHSSGRRYELRFDGVCRNADVYLNGVHLGFHPYPYTSFAFDLTPHLHPTATNVLAVRVDNTGQTSRWYDGAGIFRHTWLTTTGPLRIPLYGIHVTTPQISRRRALVRTEVQVESHAGRHAAAVRVTILNARGRRLATRTTPARTLNPAGPRTFTAQLPVLHPALWSPDSPTLYRARVEVIVAGRVVDRQEQPFGIRTIAWNATDGFVLNGRPTKILGGCIHDDYATLGTAAIGRAEERKLAILKAGGFNAIRASHNPRSPNMLDLCDRLGLLVWDEFTDMWDVGKTPDDYSRHFPEWWERDLTSMIRRDRNHPSVVIWSIGNEIPSDPSGYGPKLAAKVRSLDATRPVSLGGMNFGPSKGPDPGTYLDVPDVHYGNIGGQLDGLPATNTVNTYHDKYPTRAIAQSESFPASIYEDTRLAADNRWFAGNWVWAAWDYLGESGCGATPFGPVYQVASAYALAATSGSIPYPWFQDFQGDFDLIGQRKPQNRWRSVVYGLSPIEVLVERPPPLVLEHQYAALWGYYDELESWTWNVPHGQSMTVHVYTSGDRVELQLNGATVAATNLTDADQRIATLAVPYAPGELTAIASRNGTEIGRRTLSTTGAAAALRLTSDVRALTTGRDDLAHVLIEVLDAAGRRVPDAVVRVEVAATGAGTLIGMANGNPHNVDSFRRPHRYTWHGQALAVLRPAKHPGEISLTATAAGLSPATLTLKVRKAR